MRLSAPIIALGRSPQMRILLAIVITVVISVLSGCSGFTIPGKVPDPLGDGALLDSLIGKKRTHVYKRLGEPENELTDGNRHFILYSAKSDGVVVGFWLYVPIVVVPGDQDAIHCLLIELDSENVVKRYKIESGGFHGFESWAKLPTCEELFWSAEERQTLNRIKDELPIE